MLSGSMRLRHYLDKHALYPPQICESPDPDARFFVVIPCYNEPDITTTLASLWACQRPSSAVEVLIVVNASSRATLAAHAQNQATLDEIAVWQATHQSPRFRFHALHFPDLPAKHAGVGLARKVGLDEAVARIAQHDQDGILINLDADCLVDPNYFVAIEETFSQQPQPVGTCIYFEHPLEGNLPVANYEAIAQYELHLRYFVQGLRIAQHPSHFHTVGSTIALPAQVYAKIGGMNKRRGGEDFYFLQKLAQYGHITNTNTTCVRPDARLSDRNPFGTGPALTHMLEGQQHTLTTYHPDAFHILKEFKAQHRDLYSAGRIYTREVMARLDPTFAAFLEAQGLPEQVASINQHTASVPSFYKRLEHWFHGFRVVKWAHFFRDNAQPNLPVEEAALALLPEAYKHTLTGPYALLHAYRRIDLDDHRPFR